METIDGTCQQCGSSPSRQVYYYMPVSLLTIMYITLSPDLHVHKGTILPTSSPETNFCYKHTFMRACILNRVLTFLDMYHRAGTIIVHLLHAIVDLSFEIQRDENSKTAWRFQGIVVLCHKTLSEPHSSLTYALPHVPTTLYMNFLTSFQSPLNKSRYHFYTLFLQI